MGQYRDVRLIATLIAPETIYGRCLLTRVYTRVETRNVCCDTCESVRLTLVRASRASSFDLFRAHYL